MSFLVREAGVEPARPCEHRHLKPASLPIPPLAHLILFRAVAQRRTYITTTLTKCQHLFSFFRKIFKAKDGHQKPPVLWLYGKVRE